MSIDASKIPDGFNQHFRSSSLTDPWEPLFSRVEEGRVRIGLVLAEQHCNSRGLVHGGLITALADNAMGLSCATVMKSEGREIKGLVTISLSADFMGMAKTGAWLEINTDHVKCGGSICFARALVLSDGASIAQTSATFKIL